MSAASDDEDHQIGYQALPPGVPVVTSDGVRMGVVHRVQDNAREHIFDGIVVKTDTGSVFVDAPEVARISLRQVTLTIDAQQATQLAAYRGGSGATKITRRHWWNRLGR